MMAGKTGGRLAASLIAWMEKQTAVMRAAGKEQHKVDPMAFLRGGYWAGTMVYC